MVKRTWFCYREIKEVWKNISPVHLLPKLLEVSAYMARCGRVFFHKFREKIKEQKSIIDRLADMTNETSVQEYIAAKENLNNLFLAGGIVLEEKG